MEHQANKSAPVGSKPVDDSKLDIDALLHPAGAFAHPMDVVRDTDLTLYEKRAILASWASDACAVAAAPELRLNPAGRLVRWDDIMDALRALDREAESRDAPGGNGRPWWRRHRGWRARRGGEPDHGPHLG